METLLPSEIARLVLGYLEEEKCEEASKCFLNSSSNLNEIRSIALKGKKYPTKVNSYSLKEILEEYCLVHSIVQESLSSMTEQPSVGGSMIDCLRFLVRARQPVHVNINLHPQQGQGASLNKPDVVDTNCASSRARTKKISFSLGQNVENIDATSTSQPGPSQILPDSSSTQTTTGSSNLNPLLDRNLSHLNNNITITPNQHVNQSVNIGFSAPSLVVCGSHKDEVVMSHPEQHCSEVQQTFQTTNIDSYQETPSVLPNCQLSESAPPVNDFQQQMHLPANILNETTNQAGRAEFVPQSQEGVNMLPPVSNVMKMDSEEPVRSFTVTQCFGSNIVILENDSNVSQSCLPTSGLLPSNSVQDNDIKKNQLGNKLPTPTKNRTPPITFEQFSEKLMKNEVMVSKLVENINRVWTPAKESRNDESQPTGEGCQGLDEAVNSILKETTEDPCFDDLLQQFLQFDGMQSSSEDNAVDIEGNLADGKKKKRVRKKKKLNISAIKQQGESSVSNFSAESSTPSKQSLDKVLVAGRNSSVPEGETPAKMTMETDTMTPITKLLKSITSPSGELYLDPAQLSSLIDLPGSTTKSKDQNSPSTSEAPLQTFHNSDGAYSKFLQVPQPNGTTISVPMVICNSNQQVAQYVNEKGVSTIFTGEIQVMPHKVPFVPIMPRLVAGTSMARTFELPDVSQQPRKRRGRSNKRCLTRGGRQAAGQTHADSGQQAAKLCGQKNTVTLYAADGEDSASSTIAYSTSSDLPILVSDVSDAPAEEQQLGTNIVENEVENSEGKPGDRLSAPASETAILADKEAPTQAESVIPDEQAVHNSREEDNNLPPLNASVIRNTPGVNGLARPHDKRMSFSTPRRRLSHIRALDFNTPPKDNDLSLRRANTSPKNMSINALSPQTIGKSIKSVPRQALLKAPTDGSKRTSKAKAHLFKSPEYAMSLSSGFKVPLAATTSTPVDSDPKVCSPLLKPSAAWDKVGGVALILDSDDPPEKRKEPACKKEVFRSWDADLRSILGNDEPLPPPPPPPPPSRKRKITPPTLKKGKKKSKKAQDKETDSEPKEEEIQNQTLEVQDKTQDTSQEVSNGSECEMAKIIEDNLLNSTSEVASPLKNGSPLESQLKPNNRTEESAIPCKVKDVSEESSIDSKMCSKKLECLFVSPQAKGEKKLNEHLPQSSHIASITKEETSLSNPELPKDSSSDAIAVAEETTNVPKNIQSEINSVTPVPDPSAKSVADKSRLNLASWKESFSFETPIKGDLANMVPQTPRFLDPNDTSKEDTPRTKIIKAIALPVPSTTTVATPTPIVPPTPTIRTSPSVSPNCPAYFQPETTSPSHSMSQQGDISSTEKSDNLENILIQECSRIEAGGMRESVKKLKYKSSDDSSHVNVENVECTAEGLRTGEDASDSVVNIPSYSEKALADQSQRNKNCEESSSSASTSPDIEVVNDDVGCARLRHYNRKAAGEKDNKRAVHAVFPGVRKVPLVPVEDNNDCSVLSQAEEPLENESEKTLNTNQEVVSSPSKKCSDTKSATATTPLLLASKSVSITESLEIEEALDLMHGKRVPEKTLKSSPKEMSLSSVLTSEQDQAVMMVGKNANTSMTISLSKDITTTPAKNPLSTTNKKKESTVKAKTASSKKSTPAKGAVTDDESSDTSSSDSSSDSDSDSSSSSSSEEGTPVKENISPIKENSPMKTKCQLVAGENPDSASEQLSADIPDKDEALVFSQTAEEKVQEEENPLQFRDVPNQLHEKLKTDPVDVDLKNLIETKDMGSCEKISKIRSAHDRGTSDILSELQQKRQRTLEQLKKGTSNRRIMKESKEKTAVPVQNSGRKEPGKPQRVQGTVELKKDNVMPITKDSIDMIVEKPKKRRSKSEPDIANSSGDIEALDTKVRRLSDSARLPDEEDEFILHLSGDEKEDLPAKQQKDPYDDLDMQIAAIHGDLQFAEKISLSKTKVDPALKAPEPSGQPGKIPPKGTVSSKAADIVIRTLMEKGFGSSLPQLPQQRIKKIDINMKNANVESLKTNEMKSSQKTLKASPKPPVKSSHDSLHKPSARSREKCSNADVEDFHHEFDANEEAHKERINTSMPNMGEIVFSYRGLGATKQKERLFLNHKFRLEDEDAYITASAFIDLYEAKSVDNKDLKVCNANRSLNGRSSSKSNRVSRSSHDWRETLSRVSCDGTSRERGLKHQDDSRSRQNRSNSPRGRRGQELFHDRPYSKDARRSKDYRTHSRSDSHRDRYESHSSHSRKYSSADVRSVESRSIARYVSQDSRTKDSVSVLTSLSKSTSKVDVEEGEIVSSDSDFQPKISSQKRRTSYPAASKRNRVRQDKTSVKEERKIQVKESTHPSRGKRPLGIASRLQCISHKGSPEKTSEAVLESTVQKAERILGKARKEKDSSDLLSDENVIDTDLDDVNFPVLGDDDTDCTDTKSTIQDPTEENQQHGMVTRRRAPPRSVNAHKTSSTECKTPVQRAKRKLSISPDVASERSSPSSIKPDKQMRLSSKSKKSASSVASFAEISTLNESEDVADATDVVRKLQNLDVDAFLDTVHPCDADSNNR